MDEQMYAMLMIAIAIISTTSLGLSIITLTNQHSSTSSAAQGVNKNISNLGKNLSNTLSTRLNTFTNTSSNQIKTTLDNASLSIANSLASENTNTITTTAGLNKNITGLTNSLSNINTNIGSVNKNLTVLPAISSNLTKLLIQTNTIINLTRSLPGQGGTFVIWTFPQSVTAGDYLINQMLDTFDMHIRMNASNSISVAVLTTAAYANFSMNKPYNTVSLTQSSGAFNSINFNFTTSEGCGDYLYIVYGGNAMVPFTLYPAVTATYNPTATFTGVCHS